AQAAQGTPRRPRRPCEPIPAHDGTGGGRNLRDQAGRRAEDSRQAAGEREEKVSPSRSRAREAKRDRLAFAQPFLRDKSVAYLLHVYLELRQYKEQAVK